MIFTRHISLNNDYVEKMKPFVEKNEGSFSAAIRELIDQAGKYNSAKNSTAIENTLFKWMLNEIDGKLVPDTVLDEIIDTRLINSMGELEEYFNKRFGELGWDINVALKYDNNLSPSEVLIEISGNPQKIKFIACMLSQFLVKKSPEHTPLKVISVINFDRSIKVELARSNKEEAIDSVIKFFGGLDEVIKTVKNRPEFWKAIINRHLLSNYNMVTIHRNYFEEVLADRVPAGETTIEALVRKPIDEIPLKEMLSLIKEVYETSRIADRVEIDRDNLILFHNYRNKEAIEKLKKILVTLLETNGHLYDAKSTANMIVLTHRPEIGIKVNEIVNNLKTSNSRVDQELIMFMAFLKGLKDIPDIPLSLVSLGRRIGKSLMQEYETENNIKNWDVETFRKAFETIDYKLHRESEWRLEGKNLLYTINKCNIATQGNTFDSYVCHAARETFKGALDYAFGSRAELEIKKLLTHGDKNCEVLIQV
ncbi:MAG: hypothetical protein Q7U60_08085 [Candidatus Methanoperedens sp.]|nr:hypothetical protein [Candidatus Methanoperedens sp.]